MYKISIKSILMLLVLTLQILLAQTHVNVTLKNVHNGNNISGSTLGVDGVNSSILSGNSLLLNVGGNYTIRTNHKMFTANKWMHHHWNNDQQKYFVHKLYQTPQWNDEQKARFNDYINTSIESSTGGLYGLQIHDPWYQDGDGVQPDDFRPLNTVAPNGNHKVFEDQQIDPSNPYYELKADDEVNTTEHNESLTWYFEKWLSPNGLTIIQSPTALETAVVFTADNAQVKAQYKAHLASQNNNLFGDSRGRKLVVSGSGNGMVYHLVYQDNGEIYYTYYHLYDPPIGDDYWRWEKEVMISDGSSQNSNPSIAVGHNDLFRVVWQKNNNIVYRQYDYSWQNINVLAQTNSADPQPVVGVYILSLWGGTSYWWQIVWKDNGGIKFYDSYNNPSPILLSGTNSNCSNPVITNIYATPSSGFSSNNIIAWDNSGDGNIYYHKLADGVTYNLTSGYTNLSNNILPSIASNSSSLMIAWQAEENNKEKIYTAIDTYSGFGSLTEVGYSTYESERPVLSPSDDVNNDYSLIWKVKNQDKIAAKKYTNGQWSAQTDIWFGENIQHPQISKNEISAFSKYNSSPYIVKVNESPATMLSQTISSTTTLTAGNYIAEATVTVNNGVTLFIDPGVKIIFENGSSLIAHGHLDIDGTDGNKAIFNFNAPNSSTHNGIKIYGSADIDYATIKNGYYGVYANQAVPMINDCYFTDCTYPVYIYKGNYVSGKASIIHNTINGASNAGTGIYLYESSPYIRDNTISDFNKGLYCKSNSSPLLGYGIYRGNNHFNNNTTGVKAYIDCNPFLGKGALGGYNLFTSDHIYYIYAKYDCEIDAEYNWWGTPSPSSAKFYKKYGSDIDYTPYLSSAPSSSQNTFQDNSKAISLNIGGELYNTEITEENDLLTSSDKTKMAVELYLSSDYERSKSKCLDVIASTPDSPLAFRTLDLLWQIAADKDNNYTLDNFKSYLYDLTRNKDNYDLYGYAKIILAGFEKENGILLLDEVLADYYESFVGEAALAKKMMYYYHEKGDADLTAKVLDELKIKYPESEFIADGKSLLNDNPTFSLKKETVKETVVPQKYALANAYPNPFNPKTTIEYALPYQSAVNVVIYNIMGQKVNSYSFSSQNAGMHKLIWNGQNRYGNKAASGLYIIRFHAKSLEGKAEIFQKSIKVIMLK